LIIDEIRKDSKRSTSEPHKVNYSLTASLSSFTSTPKAKRRKLFNYDDSSMND
jgi:hypothetical protein